MKTPARQIALLALLSFSAVAQTPPGLAQQVQSHLKGKRLENVRASADGNTVTLSGTVQVLADKLDAEEKAHKVDHVASVNDQVQVSSQMSDAELDKKLTDKLRYDRVGYYDQVGFPSAPVFNAFQIKVTNGNVTISGIAYNYPDKASAIALVESTPGVKSLNDDVEVAPASINDDDLRLALYRKIYGDQQLGRYGSDPSKPIRIIVINGHATLYGTVMNEMDRTIAGIRANEVPGLFSVRNKLTVEEQHKNKER
ncbi:MAG: BON domain-containing protein [Acidobacteriaceae bacterium]